MIDLQKLKVADLKAELAKYGLPTSGRKEELVARLSEHLAASDSDATVAQQARDGAVEQATAAAQPPAAAAAADAPAAAQAKTAAAHAAHGPSAASNLQASVPTQAAAAASTEPAGAGAAKAPTVSVAAVAQLSAEERLRLRSERFGAAVPAAGTKKDAAAASTAVPVAAAASKAQQPAKAAAAATTASASQPAKPIPAALLDDRPLVDPATLARREKRFGSVLKAAAASAADTKPADAQAAAAAPKPAAKQKGTASAAVAVATSIEEEKRRRRMERFQLDQAEAVKRAKAEMALVSTTTDMRAPPLAPLHAPSLPRLKPAAPAAASAPRSPARHKPDPPADLAASQPRQQQTQPDQPRQHEPHEPHEQQVSQPQRHSPPQPRPKLAPISKEARIASIIPSFQRALAADPAVSVDFERVFRLFTGKHTARMYDRHATVLDKLVRVYRDGPVLADLKVIGTVLQLSLDKVVAGGAELVLPLMRLIQTLRRMEISDIEIKKRTMVLENVAYILASLSKLLQLCNEEIRHHVCEAIFSFSGGSTIDPEAASTRRIVFSLNEPDPIPSPGSVEALQANLDESSERSRMLLTAAESSEIVVDITETLAQTDSQQDRIGLLKCLRRLSTSDECSRQMSEAGTVGVLMHLISLNQDGATFYAIEVLWNLLSSQSAAKDVAQALSTSGHLRVLKELFDDLALNGHRQANKQLRNEILIVLTHVVHHSAASLPLFLEVDLLDSVSLFLTHPELNTVQEVAAPIVLTPGKDDFEFKRLLLTLTRALVAHPPNLAKMLDDQLLGFLMLYLDHQSANPTIALWNDSQLRGLQVQILGLLSHLIPRISREFRIMDGYKDLMLFLDHTIEQGKLLEIARIDVAREYRGVLSAALGVLLSLTEVGPTSKKTLASLGIFNHLLNLLGEPVQPTSIWCMSFMICSSLCQGFKANKQVFGESQGVQKLIPFLKYTSAEPSERVAVILAVVECIWGSVCGNYVNEDVFFQNEGIFLLLDLLEDAVPKLKRHIMGCLLDLLENPKCIYHLLQWRMQRDVNKGIEHLLIEMWCSEEMMLGVPQGPDGTIVSVQSRPLLGERQPKIDLAGKGVEPDGGRAIHELQENLRAKIYSMFCKLGFERFFDSLSGRERIKLALISKYLDFKIGEVWAEIADELAFEGIRPVSPDLDCIQTVHQVVLKKAEGVLQRQMDLRRKSDEGKRDLENAFFGELKTREMLRVHGEGRSRTPRHGNRN
ncbi:hypothetical protein HK105_206689 [Polyrhizophydium stewartii]|uniref:SAP domain-containing protein n=1 Tax=Polyrhizophydium stewartii TaxID=2732419 RepID=A0ABR4N2R7_9FUNG